jgi:hypothetical protein
MSRDIWNDIDETNRKVPDYFRQCPRCLNSDLWDRLFAKCYACGYTPQTPKLHVNKETVRTIAAVIADIMAVLSVIIQLIMLHYVIHYHR